MAVVDSCLPIAFSQ